MTYLKASWQVFMRYRYLLGNLVQRDIKVKYRRSALGLVWSVLNPLLMMLIMTAVFSLVFRFQIEYFPVYLLCGQLMFNFFSEGTNYAMDSVLGNAPLLKKVYIPKYIFPLEKVLFAGINALLSLIPLFLVIVIMQVPLTPWILMMPIPLIILMIFNFGVGTLLSALVIFFRDIKHLYGVLVLALNYVTPIFYPESIWPPTVAMILKCNPLYWFVRLMRSLVLYGEAPSTLNWLMTIGWAFAALIIGFLVFKKTQDRFILYI